jgi:hypothetical protein
MVPGLQDGAAHAGFPQKARHGQAKTRLSAELESPVLPQAAPAAGQRHTRFATPLLHPLGTRGATEQPAAGYRQARGWWAKECWCTVALRWAGQAVCELPERRARKEARLGHNTYLVGKEQCVWAVTAAAYDEHDRRLSQAARSCAWCKRPAMPPAPDAMAAHPPPGPCPKRPDAAYVLTNPAQLTQASNSHSHHGWLGKVTYKLQYLGGPRCRRADERVGRGRFLHDNTFSRPPPHRLRALPLARTVHAHTQLILGCGPCGRCWRQSSWPLSAVAVRPMRCEGLSSQPTCAHPFLLIVGFTFRVTRCAAVVCWRMNFIP